MGHEFQLLSSVRISTKSITNFEASGSTELTRRHHNVRDQWLLTQRTKVQGIKTSVQERRWRKIGSTCISRNQRDTLRISWNVVCKLVFIRFVQSVKSTFCTVSRGFKLGIVYQFPAKTHDERTIPKEHVLHQSLLSQHHPAVPQNDTNVLLFQTQRDSV